MVVAMVVFKIREEEMGKRKRKEKEVRERGKRKRSFYGDLMFMLPTENALGWYKLAVFCISFYFY